MTTVPPPRPATRRVLRWRHADCPPFDAMRWWMQPAMVQHMPAGDGEPAEDLELRNCPHCASTLAASSLEMVVVDEPRSPATTTRPRRCPPPLCPPPPSECPHDG